MSKATFPCDCCGCCCKTVGSNDIYRHLDRGDGICTHYDEETKLCRIYTERPDICRVDVMYDLYFKDSMSWETFVRINQEACVILKKMNLG